MGFWSALFGINSQFPEEDVLYRFYDIRKFQKIPEDLIDIYEKMFPSQDALKIAPFAYIKGKKYRARFKVKEGICYINTGKKKLSVPVEKCSFRNKKSTYYQGQAHVTEYYLTVLVRDR